MSRTHDWTSTTSACNCNCTSNWTCNWTCNRRASRHESIPWADHPLPHGGAHFAPRIMYDRIVLKTTESGGCLGRLVEVVTHRAKRERVLLDEDERGCIVNRGEVARESICCSHCDDYSYHYCLTSCANGLSLKLCETQNELCGLHCSILLS